MPPLALRVSAAAAPLLLLLLAPLRASADTVMLAMRDGVLLHTEFDLPLFFNGSKRAAVLERSPYGADAEELIADVFGEALGYVSVRQDVRGTGQSHGAFGVWHDAQNDAFDTMAWIVSQSWSNGVVFTTGASADAIDELAQLPGPHPALRGQVVIFATADGYGTFFPGGAYRESLIDGWLQKTVPGDYARTDALVRNEEQPGGQWWDVVNGSMYWKNVDFPSVAWAGWYDIFQAGNWAQYDGYQRLSSLPGEHKMVVDPCGHCQAASSQFPHDTAFGRVLLPILLAFDMMSNDSPTNKTFPPVPEGVMNVTMYVMGDDENGAVGNYWTTLPEVPAATPTPLFLAAGGALLPAAAPTAGQVTYEYDPRDPVKTIGGDNLLIKCGPLDQRPNEALGRQDLLSECRSGTAGPLSSPAAGALLARNERAISPTHARTLALSHAVFTSAPLDAPLALAGEVTARVFFSTNVVDTDIVVKLIDVYPANSSNPLEVSESLLVLDGIARARWRGFPSTNEPEPLSGDAADVYDVNVSLWHTAYVFGAGHQIRLHVTSSNFNRFFPNPNTGAWMNETQGGANITATTTIRFGEGQASTVTLPVVDIAALPPFPVEEALTAMLARHTPRWEANVRSREPEDVDLRAWLTRRLDKAWRATYGAQSPRDSGDALV